MQRIAVIGVVLRAIAKSWVVWILLLPWGLLGIYDLFVSQFVPEAEARDYPKALVLLGKLLNGMPWWVWLIGLLVVFIIGVIEYVFKTHRPVTLAAAVPHPTASPAPTIFTTVVPQQQATTHGAQSPINQIGPVTGSQIYIQPAQVPPHHPDRQILPDMLISELWEHVSPEIGPTTHFQHIAKELIDAFALGKVRVWGRRFVNDRSDGALESIDADYWPCAKLSMWFLSAEKQRNTQHTYNVRPYVRANGQLIDAPYADLRVNREQALSVWPSTIPMQPVVLGFDGDGVRFSMREAAQAVFDSSRGNVSYGWVITAIDDPEVRLAYCASHICTNVRVIGVVPPSASEGILDPAPFLAGGTFSDGGNTFTRQGSLHPTYTGISVTEKNLNVAIQKLKEKRA